MHIPDVMLDGKTAGALAALSAGGLGVALRCARKNLPARRVPLMGLAAAFIFAAQMINFPVGAGTSGHLFGGVLVATLLGPSAAIVVISAVLIVQALLFADGGILTLGANIFNMALVGGVGGWGVCRAVSRYWRDFRGQVAGAALGAWLSVVLASAACSAELAVSGTVRWPVVFPTMVWSHMAIGIGEAIITALVLVSIARIRPELVRTDASAAVGGYKELALYGVVLSLGLALLVSPLASSLPDGLDRAAALHGFGDGDSAGAAAATVLAPQYKMRGIGSETIATSVAGLVGTVVVLVFSIALAKVLVPHGRRTLDSTP